MTDAPQSAVLDPRPTMPDRGVTRSILFVHHGGQWIRGSERCLIDHLAQLDRSRFEPVLWTNCMPLAAVVREQGTPVFEDRFTVLFGRDTPSFDVINSMRLVRRAAALVRERQVALVHCNASEGGQWMIPVAKAAGIPVVIQLHNESALRSRCVQLEHQATAIVGVSATMIEPHRAEGVPEQALRVVHNTVDPGRLAANPFIARESLGFERGQFVFASIGSLIRRKGFDVLLRALAGEPLRRTGAKLVIVGDGEERGALESLARDLGVADAVRFTGDLDAAPAIFRDVADAAVLSSHWEGLPLVLLEAGFFGLPCVSTNVGGVSELIEHDRTGLLVPPDDAAALGQAMARVVEQPALAARLAAGLRRRVTADMVSPTATRHLERLYDELLDQPAPALKPWRWSPAYSRLLRMATDRLAHPFATDLKR